MAGKMTDKQKKFCDEYLIDLNATQAAIRAGYAASTAQKAKQWIKEGGDQEKPSLRAYVDAALAEMSRRTGVTVERIVRELARMAFANIADIVDPATGKVRDGVSADDLAAIASVRVKSGNDYTEYEVKLADKLRALELLGKYMSMFTDRVQVSGSVPVVIDDIKEAA